SVPSPSSSTTTPTLFSATANSSGNASIASPTSSSKRSGSIACTADEPFAIDDHAGVRSASDDAGSVRRLDDEGERLAVDVLERGAGADATPDDGRCEVIDDDACP